MTAGLDQARLTAELRATLLGAAPALGEEGAASLASTLASALSLADQPTRRRIGLALLASALGFLGIVHGEDYRATQEQRSAWSGLVEELLKAKVTARSSLSTPEGTKEAAYVEIQESTARTLGRAFCLLLAAQAVAEHGLAEAWSLHDGAAAARDQLAREKRDAEDGRAALDVQLAEVKRQRDNLLVENDRLRGERDRATAAARRATEERATMTRARAMELAAGCVRTCTAHVIGASPEPLPAAELEELLEANRIIGADPGTENADGSITVAFSCDPGLLAAFYALERYDRDPVALLAVLGFSASLARAGGVDEEPTFHPPCGIPGCDHEEP